MKNKILIYDDNCPLCTWYSALFVKYRFLEPGGRKAFSSLDQEFLSKIDFNRSRNEIPLLDVKSGEVSYGIDALLEILEQKFSIIKKIGFIRPINRFLKILYKLVSYNRKVIVAQKCGPGTIDCSPDYNYFYRFSFMLLSLVFNTLMLFGFHNFVLNKLPYYNIDVIDLQAAHFGFVLMNCLLAFNFSKTKAYEYLGQVNMLALSITLLLVPLIVINSIFFSEFLNTLYLIFSAGFIFKEYIRRMDYAGVLPKHNWIVSINMLCLTAFIMFLFH